MLAPIEEIFCDIDDFCKSFFVEYNKNLISSELRKPTRTCGMTIPEIMTIVILFHMSHYRTFKDYYEGCVIRYMRGYFPNLLSYNRFITVKSRVVIPLLAWLKSRTGEATGVYYVDSTSLKVCDNKRIHNHKTFDSIAERGKTSMGWFFGFKLHLITNHQGDLMDFAITKGNVDDRAPLNQLCKNIKGHLFGDKGYLSKSRQEELASQGIKLITKVKSNMKKPVLDRFEKFFLSKRTVIESTIDILKNFFQIEHSRHRNPDNFLLNLLSALAAYVFKPHKPSIKSLPLPNKS